MSEPKHPESSKMVGHQAIISPNRVPGSSVVIVAAKKFDVAFFKICSGVRNRVLRNRDRTKLPSAVMSVRKRERFRKKTQAPSKIAAFARYCVRFFDRKTANSCRDPNSAGNIAPGYDGMKRSTSTNRGRMSSGDILTSRSDRVKFCPVH